MGGGVERKVVAEPHGLGRPFLGAGADGQGEGRGKRGRQERDANNNHEAELPPDAAANWRGFGAAAREHADTWRRLVPNHFYVFADEPKWSASRTPKHTLFY